MKDNILANEMILVCDLLCDNLMHTQVNAACLTMFQKVFNNQKVIFFGDQTHINEVRTILAENNDSSIEYKSVKIPKSNIPDYKRILFEIRNCFNLFHYAKKNHIVDVLFLSTTSAELWAIKFLQIYYRSQHIIAIPHAKLETLVRKSSLKPWLFLLQFKFPFLYNNSEKLKYIVLGKSIETELLKIHPKMKPFVYSIDLPYFYQSDKQQTSFNDNQIVFGHIGVGHRKKNTHLFIKLADEVANVKSAKLAIFSLVGHLADTSIPINDRPYLQIPTNKTHLIKEEYISEMIKIDYAVFFYNMTMYRLTASAALFDAFSYAKPVICTRIPFIEYYFDLFGDIGYLCNDYDEVKSVVSTIINSNCQERYREQVNNIMEGRKKMDIEKIADKLKKELIHQ